MKDKKKYLYRKCPVCGTRSRYAKATLIVEVKDGRQVAVPDVDAYNCKKCKGLRFTDAERKRVLEMADAVVAEIDKAMEEQQNS